MVYINVEIISIVLGDEQTVYDQTIVRQPLRCLISFLFFSISAVVCLFQSLSSYLYGSFYFYGFFFLSLSPPSCLSVCMALKVFFSKYTFIVKINYAEKPPTQTNVMITNSPSWRWKRRPGLQLKRLKKKRMLLNYCTSLNIYTVCINWNSL